MAWVNVMKSVDYIAQTAIGDAILVSAHDIAVLAFLTYESPGAQIYRLYIVYEKSWKMIIIPTLLWAATLGKSERDFRFASGTNHNTFNTASGLALISVEISTKQSALLEDTRLSRWNDCVCVFTLVLNLLVTCKCPCPSRD